MKARDADSLMSSGASRGSMNSSTLPPFGQLDRERFLLDTLAERRETDRVTTVRAWLLRLLKR